MDSNSEITQIPIDSEIIKIKYNSFDGEVTNWGIKYSNNFIPIIIDDHKPCIRIDSEIIPITKNNDNIEIPNEAINDISLMESLLENFTIINMQENFEELLNRL